MTRPMLPRLSTLLVQFIVFQWVTVGGGADDLNPVRFRSKPRHPSVVLIEKGQARGVISVMVAREKVSGVLSAAVQDLQDTLQKATGAQLPVEYGKVSGPAIVVGDCSLAAANGLEGKSMPIEGFAIKTAPDAVLIVGNDEPVGPRADSFGTAWGVYEFLERFVGVRWYFPTVLGCSIPSSDGLVIAPTWLEDAPVFRRREIWPPCGIPWNGTGIQLTPHHTRLRANNSWPINLVVHSPHDWGQVYAKDRPECFQLRGDGQRDFSMLCYGNVRTLETYLENLEAHFDHGKPAHLGIVGKAITVSPNDAEVACHCADCRRLWNPEGGSYGSASQVVSQFVAKLAREVKKRWPEATVLYLPYLNYTRPPEGIEFPDNVEVQLCGMPGLAQYKEPSLAASEQEAVDGWVRLTGRKIQNWHYSCWPEDKTKAVYLFPHTIQDFYRKNRDKTVGSFINGEGDHWPRQHLSLYTWMKVLWNPDFDVDAALREYAHRMYGPAAGTMRRLVRHQIEGWERSRWPGGRLSPRGVYEKSYPRNKVLEMEQLLARAREKVRDDEQAAKRLEYYAAPFADFFAESRDYAEGSGRTALLVSEAPSSPEIDGRLDDEPWKKAPEVSFVRALDRQTKQPQFPTTLKAVWNKDGVTFGFRMAEPHPEQLVRNIGGGDDSLAWWNDNVELFLDVTGERIGFYQFIINPNAAVYDSAGGDLAWSCSGLKTQAYVGPDFWSLEVFVPFSAWKKAVPAAGGVVWYGNFTRHRISDGKPREYQRLNTTYDGPSNNMMAFGPIRFVKGGK
ncbi:MAG: DUF4838 domain-containing protein [Planctomycetes bacterium]|nr:DUF4838 domain-containing protein [Planctomycetota bacterium]